jgi:Na+-translocating ferredoxin:NAD+ oxidoreductase RnfC subunit
MHGTICICNGLAALACPFSAHHNGEYAQSQNSHASNDQQNTAWWQTELLVEDRELRLHEAQAGTTGTRAVEAAQASKPTAHLPKG